MATVYKIKITTVKEIFEKLVNDYSNPTNGLKFESTKVEVE